MTEIPSASELLQRAIPFQFLPRRERERLGELLELRRFADGQPLVRRGERTTEVYLLATGVVEVLDPRDGAAMGTIEAGHYFGERAALFEASRLLTVRARGAVCAYAFPGEAFVRLVEEVPVFAQALANTLRVKQGIFDGYRRLFALILGLIDRREFLLSELVPDYARLKPALHPGIDEDRIDTGALQYAVARLPREVTRTTYYYLAGDLPLIYRDPDLKFVAVSTPARRRAAWQVLPGKLFVLLRDGITDVTDFLTCLCLYAIEARKIRRRLRSSELLKDLKLLVDDPTPEREEALLTRLPLEATELDGLRRVWRVDFWTRLRDVLLHHEDIALECDYRIEEYNSRASEVWVSQIREAAQRLVDVEDPDLEVHIVSSNTHSVANCLSPWLARHREAILAWGREHHPELGGAPTPARPWGGQWANPWDLLMVTARAYMEAVPGAREARAAEEAAAGHLALRETAFTGIEVGLFDLRRVDPARSDPAIAARAASGPALIVNVDYAFGQQAEEILANLLFEFGPRVRSVNVLGKAGGLGGRRGDVLLASATLLQTNDELYPLPNRDLPADLLRELASGCAIREGPVLTVAGTLLQDRILLHFYRRIWKCVGLEMEGSFFARQLRSAIETGVVRPDVATRFAYYVSDVPLEPEENLSESLRPWEGVPPLYAVTRAILRRIFDRL